MKVFFVGAGPGDPELLTVKAKQLLENCSVCIYAGSLVSPDVVSVVPEGAEKYDSAGMSLGEIIDVIKRAKQTDTDVVRLHTGDPCIYGAINEQMVLLDNLRIDYEVVPGVSSFQAAAAALKAELTIPEVSQTIILSRTSGRTPMPENQELENLARCGATLCLFLSVHKISELAQTLIPFYGKDCRAAVVFHASWPDQSKVTGTLEDIDARVKEAGFTKTAMIIVGHALGRPGTVSKLYDQNFSHGYRKAKE